MVIERARRLAAVWFADIAGYTSLSSRDAETALAAVSVLQRVARTEAELRGGRVVKFVGDGVFTAFEGVENAVRAALAVQDEFTRSTAGERGVQLRIGLHMGEVSEAIDGDLYGDGVNVASRLQSIAQPGQVVVSELVRQQLRHRSAFEIDELGEHAVKGLDAPLAVFAVRLSSETAERPVAELLQDALKPIQVVRQIGAGAMGEIWLGRDPALRRSVAIKVLQRALSRDAVGRARFFREAEAVAAIAHPNVVGVHSVGELPDGTPYFVMDYIAGESLAHRLEQSGPMSVREARRVIGQVAAALAAAHARGVVHRDIKPSNVLLDVENARALVADFGVAAMRARAEDRDPELTDTGTLVGSPVYMSPEQFLGEQVTSASDVYGLGVLAYQLLLGRGPFQESTPQRLLVAHVKEEPAPLRTLRPDVDPELDALIRRCLRKQPEQRPAAREIALQLAGDDAAVLEWPPPGLEALHGKGTRVAVQLGAGFAAPIAPWLLASISELWGAASGGLIWVMLVTLGLIAGIALLVYALATLRVTLRAVRAALELGYTSATIVEVLADHRGDTGRLIAGLREYARLEPDTRGTLRRGRVRGLYWSLAAAAAVPLIGVLVLRLVMSGTLSALDVVPLALVLGLVPFAAAGRLRHAERRLLEPVRAELRASGSTHSAVRDLVPSWYDSLRQVSHETGPRSEGRPPRWVLPLIMTAMVALIGWFVFLHLTIGIVAYTTMDLRGAALDIRRGEARFDAIRKLRHLRIDPDSTVSAAEARELVERLSSMPPMERWLAPSPSPDSLGDSPIVGAGPFEKRFALAPGALIPAAFEGLTPIERRYLEKFAKDPAAPLLLRLSRARGFTNALPGQITDEIAPFDVPIPRFGGARDAAYRLLAQAALAVDRGDYTTAEQLLRSILSAGLVMVDDGAFVITTLLGSVIANLGVDGLVQLYQGQGRTRDADAILSVLGERDRRIAQIEAEDAGPGIPDPLQLMQSVLDTSTVRAIRWERLQQTMILSTCLDVRGLIAGPSRDVRRMIERARSTLVRTAEEQLLYDAMVQQERRTYARGDTEPITGGDPASERTLRALTRAADRMLGTSRLNFCLPRGG